MRRAPQEATRAAEAGALEDVIDGGAAISGVMGMFDVVGRN